MLKGEEMKLYDLLRYGMPQSIIDAWKARQGEYLLPLQERAVKNGLLGLHDENRPENLFISAPTSAGKSFCGEMAAIEALVKRRKAVMMVPLKSIAEEKYRYFRECYNSLGIRILIVTGDHPENDASFQRGEFDLAIAIYEKFNRALTANLDIIRQIGLVIVDEVQMISEPERGPELELALTKIIGSGYSPRIVALSAVLDDESGLADWLGCRMVKETVRPVDLHLGVAVDGSFKYRSFNSGLEGQDEIDLKGGDCPDEGLIDFLKSGDGQKLVFLKSRRDTIEAARRLAAAVKWDAAQETAEELKDQEPGSLVRSLQQVLSRGVAFHNSDLTARQRAAIEAGYRRGEIRVIFTTTTLAMGVNLPAETVLLETMKYSSGQYGSMPTLVPISAMEFQSISGRAGRFGLKPEQKPGRAVVVAASDFECDVLWNEYIEGAKGNPPVSALASSHLPDIILDLLVSGFGRDRSALETALSGLFYCRSGSVISPQQLDEILNLLTAGGLIRSSLEATPSGKAVAESGLSILSAEYYRQSLSRGYPASDIGWLFLALNAADFDISLGCLDGREYHGHVYEKLLYRQFDEYTGEIEKLLEPRSIHEPLDFRHTSILKAALLLYEWADGLAVDQLEQRYQLRHGQIIKLAETAAWLLVSLGRMMDASGGSAKSIEQLKELAFRAQFGIHSAMREIHDMLGDRLHRGQYLALYENDIVSIHGLYQAGAEYLGKILNSTKKADEILDTIKSMQEEDKMSGSNVHHRIETLFNPSSIELDGGYEKERYLVRIDGFPVRLTGKSFKYLAKLAFSRLINGDGWVYKDDIESGFNQARYLYRLKQELKAGGVTSPIFENNRLGYYRLSLDPSKIHLNLGNLKNHYDFELRAMADQLALRAAS